MSQIRSYEIGPIRPPSEAYSLFVRINRNCPWNKCRFCPVYKGEEFSRRSLDEILQDIDTVRDITGEMKAVSWQKGYGGRVNNGVVRHLQDRSVFSHESIYNVAVWLSAGGRNVFLQDANALMMDTQELVVVLKKIKEAFPGVERITTYARSQTAARKSVEELRDLKEAGLTRVHIGLESGHNPLLALMNKGTTAEKAVEGGRKVMDSGLSLSEYVIIGLGGKSLWREHAVDTARVLNAIDPDFIRLRTLSVVQRAPLYDDLQGGEFTLLSSEELALEEKLFLQELDGISSAVVSDHITNLFQEIEGKLPEDKEKMIAVLDRFLSLSSEDKTNYTVGRRLCALGQGYTRLQDMENHVLYNRVQSVVERLEKEGKGDVEEALQQLTQQMV